ncbi:type II secretion system protein GspM [Halovulum sp. GXIMD14793]
MTFARRVASRLAALGILGLMAGALWLFALQPIWARVEAISLDLERKQDQKRRLEASRMMLEKEIADLQSGDVADFVWSAEQSGALTAAIQAQVGEIAARHGIQLRSITPTGTRELPSATGTRLRVEGEASLDALSMFLQELEFHQPVLMVEQAILRRLNRPGRLIEQPLLFMQIELVAPSRVLGDAG